MRELELQSPRMSGEDITAWQKFLSRKGFALGSADGYFGPRSHDATVLFQRRHRLYPDGIVGPRTRRVAREEGFMAPTPPHAPTPKMPPPPPTTRPPRPPRQGGVVPPNSTNYPPNPGNLPHPSLEVSQRLFGSFSYKKDPANSYNGRGIIVTDGWDKKNIVMAKIPQLKGIHIPADEGGGISGGRMQFHRLAVGQVQRLFKAWEDAGLLYLIRSYSGSYVPRFIGKSKHLSNHAFGAAFDINKEWNPQYKTPAATGKTGSVRELVPIANDLGFYWGGHYSASISDGMHFEVVVLK